MYQFSPQNWRKPILSLKFRRESSYAAGDLISPLEEALKL
jgi:hypothetical protein